MLKKGLLLNLLAVNTAQSARHGQLFRNEIALVGAATPFIFLDHGLKRPPSKLGSNRSVSDTGQVSTLRT